jgi:hypothetical protein
MKRDRWEYWLSRSSDRSRSYKELHPDLYQRILDGIEFGVPVDYKGDRSIPRFGRNPTIPDEYVPKVSAVIASDVAAGKKAGPFDSQPFPVMCVSPIGAVPKHGSSKVRVIHNLSYPFHGDSVNEGIVEEDLTLGSFGQAAQAVREMGVGCHLIKLDVEAAYKQVPVRREDWPLLGFKWQEQWYYERVLPFGLRSSCRLWELYAAALHFLVQEILPMRGPRRTIHYVDDFLFVVQGEKAIADQLLVDALALCDDLGLPMAADKTIGPVTELTFLGLELDTQRMEARLSDERRESLQQLMLAWGRKKEEAAEQRKSRGRQTRSWTQPEPAAASVHELQSLAGKLNFACIVVRPGRHYLRRIINHTARVAAISPSRSARFPISAAVWADIEWWRDFLDEWNGVSLLYEREWTDAPLIELYTDACNVGYGARFGRQWFAGRWTPEEKDAARRYTRMSMPFLELRALVFAAATWGRHWRGRKITFRCDCMPVVQAIARGSSRSPATMHQLRHLSTLACCFGFDFRCRHVVGETNVVADVLSRSGDCLQFRAACPEALKEATAVAQVPLPQLHME